MLRLSIFGLQLLFTWAAFVVMCLCMYLVIQSLCAAFQEVHAKVSLPICGLQLLVTWAARIVTCQFMAGLIHLLCAGYTLVSMYTSLHPTLVCCQLSSVYALMAHTLKCAQLHPCCADCVCIGSSCIALAGNMSRDHCRRGPESERGGGTTFCGCLDRIDPLRLFWAAGAVQQEGYRGRGTIVWIFRSAYHICYGLRASRTEKRA